VFIAEKKFLEDPIQFGENLDSDIPFSNHEAFDNSFY